MSFINPFLLWGLAAAAVPIVIHLLNRRRFRRQRWAAMEWLLRAAKQNKRRLQIQNLLLLLLRALAILLLALAIARPTFSDSPLAPVANTRAHLFLLLDNSASMTARGGTRTAFDEAVTTANGLISALGDEDPVTLVLTNDTTGTEGGSGRPRAFPESRNHAKLRSLLSELRPAAARADLLDALKVLEDRVPSQGAVVPKVAIITDLQEVTIEGVGAGRPGETRNDVRGFFERLKEKGADVLLIPVGRPVDNVAVVSLGPDDNGDIIEGSRTRFVAEIVNYSSREQRVEVRFLVDGTVQGDSGHWVTLPPRPSGPEAPPAVPAEFDVRFETSSPSFHSIEARIDTDALPMDDVRTYAFNVRPPIQVLAVDGDPHPEGAAQRSEIHFMAPTLAIEEGGPFNVAEMTAEEFRGQTDLSGWDLIVLANVAEPAADQAARQRLERFVSRGGALFLTVGNRVVPQIWNETLHRAGNGLLPAAIGGRYYNEDQPILFDLGENDHPALRAICDPGMASFFESPLQHGFVRLVNVAAEKRSGVVLRFTDLARSPALIEKRFGRGRVMLLTTTVDAAWGKLPGSYVFPVLLHEIAYHMTARGEAARNLLTFQPYRTTLPKNADDFEITAPDGSRPQVEPDRSPDELATVRFRATDQVGLYRTRTTFKPDSLLQQPPPPAESGFAVNLTSLESDLRRLSPSELENRWQRLVTVAASFDGAAESVRTRGGEVATHLLVAALLCMLAEVLLARRIGAARSQVS